METGCTLYSVQSILYFYYCVTKIMHRSILILQSVNISYQDIKQISNQASLHKYTVPKVKEGTMFDSNFSIYGINPPIQISRHLFTQSAAFRSNASNDNFYTFSSYFHISQPRRFVFLVISGNISNHRSFVLACRLEFQVFPLEGSRVRERGCFPNKFTTNQEFLRYSVYFRVICSISATAK